MIVAIVQARMSSTRLPGKTLADLEGKPLIERVIARISLSKRLEKVVLATSTNPTDDPLAEWAARRSVRLYRGHLDDVLGRYADCAAAENARTIVRLTGDNPFKDPKIIDDVIDLYERKAAAFAYNNHPPTFPEGLDVEVFSRCALDEMAAEATDPFEREHVTQFMFRRPERFKQVNFRAACDDSDLRLTVDTAEDLALARQIQALLGPERYFSAEEIVALLRARPDLAASNRSVQRSHMYSHLK